MPASHFAFCILHFAFCIAFLSSHSSAASTDEKWTLTTADFHSEAVILKGFDSSGVKVAAALDADVKTIPADRFLDVSRPLPAAPAVGKYVLHLTGGDRLSGMPVTLKADSLVWTNPQVGQIEIPSSRLVAITPPLVQTVPEQKHEDVVSLANGDTVRGIVASMSGDKVTVQTSAGNTDVPLSAMASVSFAATPGGNKALHGYRVRLDDGSSLVGSAAKLDGKNLVLTLGKNADRKIALGHVASIEQVNGPVSWLSSRAPSQSVYYPFIGPPQQPAAYMDRQWLGRGPIEFKGQSFPHGIGVHAYSRLTWLLDGKYAAFRTRYAVEGDSSLADVTVRVILDDKVVHEQKNVRAGALSPVILQDLKGGKTLTLEVDGGSAYAQDALDWISPALLEHMPPPTTQPASD
ncbi:MAG TPA: NPCBM/NEW2 domain-containing protein [Tepidisphaeraceae bacterium]|nr:NPCBM/NEW2 domain-containing protein [Tepidisphaeraceae bacterium]